MHALTCDVYFTVFVGELSVSGKISADDVDRRLTVTPLENLFQFGDDGKLVSKAAATD